MSKLNNILMALDVSTLGMDKENLFTAHNAISKSALSYCAPIWRPSLRKSKRKVLQTSQNAALRTALGCTKMTDHPEPSP